MAADQRIGRRCNSELLYQVCWEHGRERWDFPIDWMNRRCERLEERRGRVDRLPLEVKMTFDEVVIDEVMASYCLATAYFSKYFLFDVLDLTISPNMGHGSIT